MTLDSLGVTWLMIEQNTGLLLARDRGHLHRHVEGFERDVAVALAERRLGLELCGSIRPSMTISASAGTSRSTVLAFDDADRLAGEPAGDAELVEIDGELLRPGEHHDRRGADHDGDRHLLAAVAVFEPVPKAAGAGRLARHHAHREPIGRLQRRAIGAHVLHAAVGIAGDAQRRREIRRGIEARRRDRHRQRVEPARRFQLVAGDDHLLARRRRRPRPARSDERSPAIQASPISSTLRPMPIA